MQGLAQYYLPGAVALWCAVAFALASLWGYAKVLFGEEDARGFARRAYLFYALSVVAAGAVLMLALWRRDFRIEYVQQYSGLDLAGHFQLAAFWAGQKGSFLIWLVWAVLLGVPLAYSAGQRAEAATMGIYQLTTLGLLFILVRENPFIMLPETPLDGAGLNPLLQDDWMVIHPPIMFIGYALTAVPFAMAIAALWRRDYDGWAARAFPWALAGFLVLGCAILMGGYWAYKTLGWGGFWGWDPVENASLVPWLITVSLIHGMHMERAKKRYRRANYLLAWLAYLAVLYGTFLTRSGVLADFSVHSFVDLGISGWLVALMAVFSILPLYLLITRWREVPTRVNADPQVLSRGFFMVLATVVVGTSAVVIAGGTSAPLITGLLTFLFENPAQVPPSRYNLVNMPLALLIALLLGVVPFVTWRGARSGEVLRRLIVPSILGLALTIAAAVWAVRNPLHLLYIFLATVAVVTNLHKTVQRGLAAGPAAAGGWLAHVGVGVILLGFIASSAYDRSSKVTLTLGEPREAEEMTLTFTRMLGRTETERERMEIKVERPDGSEYYAYPKMFLNDRTRQLMVNPHIRSMMAMDIYISPLEFDPGREPGQPERVQLARGQTLSVDGTELTFEDFDVAGRDTLAMQVQSGQPITLGAVIAVDREGEETRRVMPLYTIDPARGMAQATPARLPGGGAVQVASIIAAEDAVILDVAGLGPAEGIPPKLAIDVTKKPLIQLVWIGLYIILAGGLLAAVHRGWQAMILERIETGRPLPGADRRPLERLSED